MRAPRLISTPRMRQSATLMNGVLAEGRQRIYIRYSNAYIWKVKYRDLLTKELEENDAEVTGHLTQYWYNGKFAYLLD